MPILWRTQREALTDFHMAELVAAARKLFSERGFHEATMEAIARIAVVAKGTIYLYCPSRQAAYDAALEQGILRVIESTHRNMEAAASVEAKIRTFLECKIGYFDQDQNLPETYFSELGHSLPCRNEYRHANRLTLKAEAHDLLNLSWVRG